MKKVIFYLLFLAGFQAVSGQSQLAISAVDSLQTIKEINFYEDTLWVMDSSHFYNSIDYNLQLAGTYNVLSRDERGNKLTGLGMGNRVYGVFEYTYLDSVFYFSGTNDVHYNKTYYWNGVESKWMDNQYQLYDENQKLIEQYTKGWNLYENQYKKGSQVIKEYDNELLLSTTNNNYLPLYGTWEHDEKEITYYNESGKDSIWLKLKWGAENNQWENEQMKKTFYNEQGKDSLRLKLNWDRATGHWENEYMYKTFYNDSLNYMDSYGLFWDGELFSWINDIHRHYIYNENSQIDTLTTSLWDRQQNKWVFDQSFIISYNASGQVVERLSMLFDEHNGNWINHVKYDYAYDELRIESIRYEWDTINGFWIPDYRHIRSHTADSTSFTRQYDFWDSLSQQWVPSSRFVSSFDVRLNQTEGLFQIWDNTTETWITMQQSVYFWSPFNPLDVNEFELTEFNAYPNPAKSMVTFAYTLPPGTTEGSIEIHNLTGQRVAAIPLNLSEDKVVFDTRELPPGIYIYTLKTARAATTHKLVITR